MSNNVEHLKMIEGVIDRLARNSFALKGWSITLVTALFVFAGVKEKAMFLLFGLIPVIFFWILDSYYLWLEKRFRGLYDEVRVKDKTDFSMSLDGIKKAFPMFTVSEWPFYIPQIALLVIIFIVSGGCCAL